MVAGFYLLFVLCKFLVDFPAIVLVQRKGAHFGLAVSFVFYMLQLAGVLGFTRTHQFIFLIIGGISFALIDCFGGNARHMYVSAIMDDHNKSSSMATMEILGQVADLSGPLIGAIIGSLFGGDWLLVVALACLIFTIKPLSAIRELPVLDQKTKLRFTFRAAPLRDSVADACFGSEETVSRTLWPMYLAVTLSAFSQVGAVAVISAIGTIFAVWLAGRRGDQGKYRTVLAEGVSGMSVVNVLRLMATTFRPIAALGVAYQIAQGYALNGLNTTYYSHAKDKGLQYIVSIELASDMGYLITWSILYAALSISHSSDVLFRLGFIIAAVAVWGTLLYTPYKSKNAQHM